MLRKILVAAAICISAAVGPAHALGLGEIKVGSGLNQRFSGVIPFTSLSADEAANLRVRLADNADFSRAGLERASYLSSLKLNLITDDGNPRIELSSNEIAREPLLTMLIEVRISGGPRVLREYTVFLDPPAVGAAAAAAAPQARAQPAPAAEAVSSPAAVPAASASEFYQTPEEASGVVPAAPAEERSEAAPAVPRRRDSYGPVRAGETLLIVARTVNPQGVMQEQTAVALYDRNPSAFVNGDINALRKGVTLKVPTPDEIKSISGPAARARLRDLNAQNRIAPPPVEAAPPAEPPAAAAPPQAVPEAPAAAATAPAAVAEAPAPAPATPAEPAAPAAEPATAAAEAGIAVPDVAPIEGSEAPAVEEAPVAEEPLAEEPAAPAPAAAPPVAPTSALSTGKLWMLLAGLVAGLIGVAIFRSARERRAQREYELAAQAEANLPPPRARGSAGIAARAPTSALDELEALDRKAAREDSADLDDERPMTVNQADDDRTRLDVHATSGTGPAAAAAPTESEVSAQMNATTKKLDLGSNDPLAESEFHLAYGLYDEAALLLQQAAEKDPGRTELRVKLAETYFAAGKAEQFRQTAEPLKARLSAQDWSKIAIMGRQLCPDAAVFADDGEVAVDLALDDLGDSGKVDEGLEFRIDELELPARGAADTSAKPAAALEFDLGEFDLGGDDKATKPAPGDVSLKDFDLGHSGLSGPGDSDFDVTLAELDPMVLDDPQGADVSSDEAGTKLDLARAYIDMGDAEMARSLLEEVAVQGSDEQKREAAAMRLSMKG